MRRPAIGAGLARVVRGELPTTFDGEPRLSFLHSKLADRLADAIEADTLVLGELLKSSRNSGPHQAAQSVLPASLGGPLAISFPIRSIATTYDRRVFSAPPQ